MHPPFAANPNMADKVKVAVKLDLEHELGHDHYQTWQSQLDIAFQLHAVDEAKHKYLAAAANLGESASHYLWQKYPTCPEGDNPYADLISLFDEYFGGRKSSATRLAELFAIAQRPGETVQAFRIRLEKEMRACALTSSAKLEDVIAVVGVHLFARGLRSQDVRQRVLELEETPTLSKAAQTAQSVTLAAASAPHHPPPSEQPSVSFAASAPSFPKCRFCGRSHPPGRASCPAAGQVCRSCGKRDHFQKVCQSRRRPSASQQQANERQDQASHDRTGSRSSTRDGASVAALTTASQTLRSAATEYPYTAHSQSPAVSWRAAASEHRSAPSPESFSVWSGAPGFTLPLREVELDRKHRRKMRVDSASMVTVLPKSLVPAEYHLRAPPCTLRPLGASQLLPVGVFDTEISYKGRSVQETVFVVEDGTPSTPSLLSERASIGLGLLSHPEPEANPPALSITASPAAAPGTSALPPMKGAVTVQLDSDAIPVQQPARRVAPALVASLKEQLSKWVQQGVVEMVDEVTAKDFISPLVPVAKRDGSIRWCVDLRRVNEAVRRPGVQLPTADDLLAQLADARVFSKIDLRSGYSQLPLTPDCRHAFVIASPLGHFRFCRLPFGVSSGPEIFQRKMEQLLSGCEGVVIYLDDILVFAQTAAEHNRRLAVVQKVLKEAGVTINEDKSEYRKGQLTFLGHLVSANGIKPGPDKVAALQGMPDPSNTSELRSFLGLATYLSKFVPSWSEVAAPLTNLLGAGAWNWTEECAQAASQLREYFEINPVLSLFDPSRQTRIEVDASGVGLGAVLMQLHDDAWRPVYYASRRLTSPETRYAAIEREALAVVWGVDRFRSFITGMPLTVLTDHKPLLQVFRADYKLTLASPRVQRLVLKVQDLSFTVQYRPGKHNVIADALSRLPTGSNRDSADEYRVCLYLSPDDGLSSAERRRIAEETTNDPVFCAVREALVTGNWPTTEGIGPFQALRQELSIWPFPDTPYFILLRGERLVIPQAAVSWVLGLAHTGHPSAEKMVERLREVAWWPGWTKAAKKYASDCEACAKERRMRPVPLKPRDLPPGPWHTIAVDLFYYQQRAFFSALDVYSRYPVVVPLTGESTSAIISALDSMFCLFGTPERVISDNGPQFVSTEFANFLSQCRTQHERIVPYTPRQNPVERLHQTLKRHMRKSGQASATVALREALSAIRSTINVVTGHPPGDLFLRGGYRTPLRSLCPPMQLPDDIDDEVRVRDHVAKQAAKERYDERHHAVPSTVNAGDEVFVRQADGSTDRAQVQETSQYDAVVTTAMGATQRRHLDNIAPTPPEATEPDDTPGRRPEDPSTPAAEAPRRSQRIRKPVNRLNM